MRPPFARMKASRTRAEKLLAANPTYYDAWVAVGLENYMLSVRPAPVRFLLRVGGGQTDKALGLEKLRLAAERGPYLAPFARLLLAVAALRDHHRTRSEACWTGHMLYFRESGCMHWNLAGWDRSPRHTTNGIAYSTDKKRSVRKLDLHETR